MKTISLTKGKVAVVDDDMYEFLNQKKWHVTHFGYAASHRGRKMFLMHREVLSLRKGEFADHINHDRLDNRKCNLRPCTVSQNNMNMPLRSDNSSGFKGVCYHKIGKKWMAYIDIDRKRKYLGLFKNKKDAAICRDEKAKEFHGQFALLNFPIPI